MTTPVQVGIGPRGPSGATGSAGPNEISVSTDTAFNGWLYGNGANVDQISFTVTVEGNNNVYLVTSDGPKSDHVDALSTNNFMTQFVTDGSGARQFRFRGEYDGYGFGPCSCDISAGFLDGGAPFSSLGACNGTGTSRIYVTGQYVDLEANGSVRITGQGLTATILGTEYIFATTGLVLCTSATPAAARTTLQITEPTAALVGSYDDLVFPGLAMGGKWAYLSWHPLTTTSIWAIGSIPVATAGTVSTPDRASTNYRTQQSRAVVTGSASAGQVAQIRSSLSNVVFRGSSAGQGGWFLKYTFATETAVSGSRFLCGLRAGTTIASGTQPSSLTDCVFIGNDAADTNLQIMHNDSAGTCTKIDLGSSFPANTANTVFTLYLFAEPNGSAIYYEVRRRDSAAVASGTLSSNLPTAATHMNVMQWGDNNATAAAVILNMLRMDLWTKM